METPRTFSQFVVGMFSEPDGTPSASRVISFFASLVWLLLLTVNYFKTGQLPSAAELFAGGVGANAPYIANKLTAMLQGLGASNQRQVAVSSQPSAVSGS